MSHSEVFVDDHVSSEDCPVVTDAGLAEIVTVGAGVGAGGAGVVTVTIVET
jgi:hypothetical protein